jgi:hypothetical protein
MEKGPQSFEVTEYSGENDPRDVTEAIHQTVQEMERESPKYGVIVSTGGTRIKILYHSFEMFLPQRLRLVNDLAEDALKKAISELKKGVKKKGIKNFDLKELKDEAGHAVEKVSLNERYYFRLWRVFEVK